MSGILGVFGTSSRDVLPAEAGRPMLDPLRLRGQDREQVHREPSALVAAVRSEWERVPWLAGPTLITRHEASGVVVAADAAIYYRDDLVRAIEAAGVDVRDREPAALIAAAYVAWGEACARAQLRIERGFGFRRGMRFHGRWRHAHQLSRATRPRLRFARVPSTEDRQNPPPNDGPWGRVLLCPPPAPPAPLPPTAATDLASPTCP